MSIDPSGAPGPPPAAPDPMAALADVRNQLLRIGQQIAEMRADPGTAGVEAANGVIAELREAVRFLAERLDGVARMVAQRGEELADTRGALGAIDAHVRSQAETIGVLTTGMQALPSYGERIAGLQDNINGVQQRLGGIENAFGPIGQRLGSIETSVSRPDSGVSERLAAIEGMLGPLSQRLGQSLTEHSASLQALHGRVEALAANTQAGLESVSAGTQAALAVPVPGDGSGAAAVAELDPKLSALAADVAAMRQQLSTLSSTALSSTSASAAAAPAPTVDLSGLRDEIAALIKAQPAPAPAAGSAPAVAATGDVDAAIASAEERIKEHIDDAVLALAQTLLGRSRIDAPGGVAPVDSPVDEVAVAPVAAARDEDDHDTEAYEVAHHGEADDSDVEDEYEDEEEGDEYDEDEEYDDEEEDEFVDDVAPIDFSAAQLADEPLSPIVAWTPASSPPVEAPSADSHFYGSAPQPSQDPYDQEAAWLRDPQGGQEDPTVVPGKRKRWFSR